MNYIAFFSTQSAAGMDHARFFSMVVSARNGDQAIEKLEQGILNMAQSEDSPFEGIHTCYLDSVIEMECLPQTPMMIHFMQVEDRHPIPYEMVQFDPEKDLIPLQ